jgi:hypothetical protein
MNNYKRNSVVFLYVLVSACQQRMTSNSQALKTHITKARLRLELGLELG